MSYRFTMLVTGLLAVGCGKVDDPGVPDASPQSDASTTDAGNVDAGNVDAAGPACDVTKPFGTAMDVMGIHDPLGDDVHAALTPDELTIYFASNRADHTNMHIYTSTRSTRDAAFPMPGIAPGTFSNEGESHPSVSPDGNTIYFDSFRPGAPTGNVHIFTSTRMNASVAFPMPTLIVGDSRIAPTITTDGKVLYAANLEDGGISRWDRTGTGFGMPQRVPLNFQFTVQSPVTSDDLTLFMSKGAGPGNEIHVTTRRTVTVPWPTPIPVDELKATTVLAEPSWLSADGCTLYLTYQATSSDKSRIFVATRPK